MYNDKTTILLKAIIKFCYFALAFATAVIWIIPNFGAHGISWIYGFENKYYTIAISFSLVVPAGYVALVFIDKLLTNVKRKIIFENETPRYLNTISYACFYASAVALCSVFASFILKIDSYILMFCMLFFGEIFMALMLKVIKSVFEKAIEIKEENDLTV